MFFFCSCCARAQEWRVRFMLDSLEKLLDTPRKNLSERDRSTYHVVVFTVNITRWRTSEKKKKKLLALLDLLSSSDSEDEDTVLIDLLKLPGEGTAQKRPKITTYVSEVVAEYSDEEFRRNFRVLKSTCNNLVEGFKASKFMPSNRRGKAAITAEKHVLSFLWFAGNKSCIRDVAGRFNMSESTFHVILTRVMDYLLSIAPRIVKFPSEEETPQIVEQFRQVAGFPGVLGCIDGTYIPIRTPAGKLRNTYVNRHDGTSITLQGICGPNRKFFDVFTGPPSKIHDARIFKMSYISKDLPRICFPDFHILGDSAYPIKEYLITPYKDYGNLTSAKKDFNYKLCATRVLIENAFGILKQRFRQLLRTDFWYVDTITKFVVSCCVLHNLCIDSNDLGNDFSEDPSLQEYEDPYECPTERAQQHVLQKKLGELKRDRLCQELRR